MRTGTGAAIVIPPTPMSRRYRTARQAASADVGRAIARATGGALAFAPIEYALTLWAYPGPVDGKLRLAALTATLSLWLWLVLVLGLAAVMLAARLSGDPRRPGLFAASEPVEGVRRGVPARCAL